MIRETVVLLSFAVVAQTRGLGIPLLSSLASEIPVLVNRRINEITGGPSTVPVYEEAPPSNPYLELDTDFLNLLYTTNAYPSLFTYILGKIFGRNNPLNPFPTLDPAVYGPPFTVTSYTANGGAFGLANFDNIYNEKVRDYEQTPADERPELPDTLLPLVSGVREATSILLRNGGQLAAQNLAVLGVALPALLAVLVALSVSNPSIGGPYDPKNFNTARLARAILQLGDGLGRSNFNLLDTTGTDLGNSLAGPTVDTLGAVNPEFPGLSAPIVGIPTQVLAQVLNKIGNVYADKVNVITQYEDGGDGRPLLDPLSRVYPRYTQA